MCEKQGIDFWNLLLYNRSISYNTNEWGAYIVDARVAFGECLQEQLTAHGLTASKAARLVGFRSRNSIFRILSGETSAEVDARFLAKLKETLGEAWPTESWRTLENALDMKRVGPVQHCSNQALCQAMSGGGEKHRYMVEYKENGQAVEHPLEELLREICRRGNISVGICGCCERSLAAVLAASMNDAGCEGRLRVRHYIDTSPDVMVSSLLSVLPLMSKVWYNARLVGQGQCPPEMAAVYRLNIISIIVEADGGQTSHQLLQCDTERFVYAGTVGDAGQLLNVMDRFRFQLAPLKPITPPQGGPEDFVAYTESYLHLEQDCMILSIKPDVHFNFVPSQLLYTAIEEGFRQSGMASGEGLAELLAALQAIHDQRFANITGKHRPTHFVYSLQAMERFMRTGVQSDHFFIQRAYTVEERRAIVRLLLEQMQNDPYFNVWFLRPELPEIRAEMTFYEGKGVLLMDAYTSYDLHDDHSEAVVPMPEFMQSFQRFFMDVLLGQLVLSRAESMAALERLLVL